MSRFACCEESGARCAQATRFYWAPIWSKPPKVLVPAYDDAQGVTAGFNKNMLARLNRELDADFDLTAFRHVAVWNKRCSRMEMHLESVSAQRVFLAAVDMDVSFAAGERIHTENSYKYTRDMVSRSFVTADSNSSTAGSTGRSGLACIWRGCNSVGALPANALQPDSVFSSVTLPASIDLCGVSDDNLLSHAGLSDRRY